MGEYEDDFNIDECSYDEAAIISARTKAVREGMSFQCIIVVTYSGWQFIQEIPVFVRAELFGCVMTNNDFRNCPTKPGIYKCEVGVYEYERLDSEYFFVIREAVKMKLVPDEDVQSDDLTFMEDVID